MGLKSMGKYQPSLQQLTEVIIQVRSTQVTALEPKQTQSWRLTGPSTEQEKCVHTRLQRLQFAVGPFIVVDSFRSGERTQALQHPNTVMFNIKNQWAVLSIRTLVLPLLPPKKGSFFQVPPPILPCSWHEAHRSSHREGPRVLRPPGVAATRTAQDTAAPCYNDGRCIKFSWVRFWCSLRHLWINSTTVKRTISTSAFVLSLMRANHLANNHEITYVIYIYVHQARCPLS